MKIIRTKQLLGMLVLSVVRGKYAGNGDGGTMIEYMVHLEVWPKYPLKNYPLGYYKLITAKDFPDLKRKIWEDYKVEGCDIYVDRCVECHYRPDGEKFSPFWLKWRE